MTLRIISGDFQGHPLKSPKGSTTRPTKNSVRESVFNICQFYIKDSHFLDLFAGSGAMGFEALSRKAAHTTFIEKDKQAAQTIEENITSLKVQDRTQVLNTDYHTALKHLTHKYDIIYADPPYGLLSANDLLQLLQDSDILNTKAQILFEDEVKEHTLSLSAFSEKKTRKWGKTLLHQYIFNG